MRYLNRPFTAKKGNKVHVTFDKPARVLLLTGSQYKNYHQCQTFKYRGGFSEKSPIVFDIPHDGKWHIIVELGNYYHPEKITASVSLQKD